MANNLQKIKALIIKSNLSLADQIELCSIFDQAKDIELEQVRKLFLEDSS